MKRYLLVLSLCGALSAWAQNQTVNGLKQGPWKVTYEGSTTLRYEGQFDRGTPIGTFRHYHQNGSIHAIMKFRGLTGSCSSQEFSPEGVLLAEGVYSAPGRKDSTWTIYGPNQVVLILENYRDGQLNGPYQSFYPSGKKVESGAMRDGYREGEWSRWSEKGVKIRSCKYVNGQLNGIWTEYDNSGRPLLRGTYLNDLKEGQWVEYESGKPKTTYSYVNGRLVEENAE